MRKRKVSFVLSVTDVVFRLIHNNKLATIV